MTKRPNILFLMSDEHRPDVTGYEGNTVIRTPVLDELARTGVVFRNAYTASPACIPARQCMMAGQLPKTCGCEGWIDLPPQSMTFARRFSQYAYMTTCFGKLHHSGSDPMQGWVRRLAGDVVTNPKLMTPIDEASFAELTWPDGTRKWPLAKELQRAGPGYAPSSRWDDLCLDTFRWYVNDMVFGNPYYDRASPHHPHLLKLSLNRPHYPFLCEEEKFTYYLNRVRPFVETEPFNHPFLAQRCVTPGRDATLRDLQRATAAYYGMIEELDVRFGQALAHLRHAGQDLDDWIIVYTSDHGDMLGEHGVWEKIKFFEASARVPLIVRWPKRFAPRIVEENVNLCDLFATLCDLAEIPLPQSGRGLDSRSLVPLMRGETRHWHDQYHDETISQYETHNLMIKRGALKYQWYGPDMPEVLFDLKADPGERRNVVNEPAYRDTLAAFRQRRAELGHGPDADPDYRNAGYGGAS